MSASDSSDVPLFVYGTLMPGNLAWHLLSDVVQSSAKMALITGYSLAFKHGFPVLLPDDFDSAQPGRVTGFVVDLVAASRGSALRALDQYEGVSSSGSSFFAKQTVSVTRRPARPLSAWPTSARRACGPTSCHSNCRTGLLGAHRRIRFS